MATTNLQQWNPTAVNQETDAQYTADSQRAGGATDPSVFLSLLANKAFYQWSTYLTALFAAFAAKGFTTSDSNLNTLTAVCSNFLTTADVKPPQFTVPFSPTPTFDGSKATSFRLDMTGSVTSSTFINVPPAGSIVTFYIVSASPGNFFFTWPANVSFGGSVQFNSIANLYTQMFISDGSTLFPAEALQTSLNVAVEVLQQFETNQLSENTTLQTNINTAQGTANSAVGLANNAQSSANAAQGTANTAVANAATAQTTANTAIGQATAAQNSANAAQGSANTALSEIAALQVVYTVHDVGRGLNQTFTNPYGLPMTVTGFAITNGGGNVGSVECFVNGVSVFANTVGATVNNGTCGFSFEVPTGATYEVAANTRTNGQGTAVSSTGKWIETTVSV